MKKTILAALAVLAIAVSASSAAAVDFKLAGRPAHGSENAPVQIVEFTDFQCPYCAKAAPVLRQVATQYGDLVRVTAVTLSLPGHAYAEAAAELALTAQAHGKFWDAYDLLFSRQADFGEANFLKWAGELGLPVAEVKKNIETHAHRDLLKANFMAALNECEVESTPTVLIAGQAFAGAKSADFYRYQINAALKAKNIASPVPDVPKPEEGTKKIGVSVVPLDMIFPVNEMKPRDSKLAVHVGGYAPDFALPTIIPGQTVKLSDFRGKKNVVLSFVPAAWTPNCSAQWPEYNEAKEQFRQLDTELLGVTVDNVPSLYSWTVTMGRPWFTIASDFWPHGKVAKTYGVLRSDGVSERAVFIIDKKGVIRYIDVHDINTRPSLDVLLKELGKLQ